MDEPIDRDTVRPKAQATSGIGHKRHRSEVNAIGQALVQAHFLAAVMTPQRLGAEVQVTQVHRLLELVGVTVGQEHP